MDGHWASSLENRISNWIGYTESPALSVTLFVDTSIWYAAADSSDRSNARAKAILKSGGQLVTSDHILLETWTLLHHKVHATPRSDFGMA
jgi:hypothetical protein